MEKKKIIFFDIDGTLVDRNGVISESTKTAIKELKENGHLCFICTGRTKSMIPQNIKELDFDGYVMGAGTEIYYQGQSIHSAIIGQELLKQTMEQLEEIQCIYTLEGPEYIYVKRDTLMDERPYFKVFIKKLGSIVKTIEDEQNYVANKFTGVFTVGSEPNMELLQQQFGETYNVVIHENNEENSLTSGLIELVPHPYTKAYGIQVCINKLGLEFEQTVAVGDSNNDLEMLEYANTAIVMGNGSEKAKVRADYITTDVDQDGIYHAMKHYQYI